MTFNLTPEQADLISDMIEASLHKANDKMRERLFELRGALSTAPGELVYKHVYQPASDDELKTLAELRDKGWGLVSHSLYNNDKGELMISLIFARYCDCKQCHNCPY